jgi:hypothetical protein
MTGQTTGAEVAACIFLATGIFATSLVPFFLLVDADRLAPRVVRDLPATARRAARTAVLTTAGLLLLLAAPNGDAR